MSNATVYILSKDGVRAIGVNVGNFLVADMIDKNNRPGLKTSSVWIAMLSQNECLCETCCPIDHNAWSVCRNGSVWYTGTKAPEEYI